MGSSEDVLRNKIRMDLTTANRETQCHGCINFGKAMTFEMGFLIEGGISESTFFFFFWGGGNFISIGGGELSFAEGDTWDFFN